MGLPRHRLPQAKQEARKKRRTEGTININDFAVQVAGEEGLKKQVDIAQVKEILSVINELLDGELYPLIRDKEDDL